MKDTGPKSACSGECAVDWPPVRANGKPTVGDGANASVVGTTTRSDGAPQVTYNGHPLYLYEGDQKPGDTNGQGVAAFGATWYALTPAGNQVSGDVELGRQQWLLTRMRHRAPHPSGRALGRAPARLERGPGRQHRVHGRPRGRDRRSERCLRGGCGHRDRGAPWRALRAAGGMTRRDGRGWVRTSDLSRVRRALSR